MTESLQKAKDRCIRFPFVRSKRHVPLHNTHGLAKLGPDSLTGLRRSIYSRGGLEGKGGGALDSELFSPDLDE